MANIQIAIIGEDKDAEEVLYKGFKIFPPEIVVLLVKEKYSKKKEKIQKELSKFGIKCMLQEVSNNLEINEVFMKIREIGQSYLKDTLVINVDTDYMSSCLVLSSAFVNGIQAIGILNEEIITYPIMKFSYYNAINEKKLKLLQIMFKYKKLESMEKLSKLSKMSLPLIAYHLKGNRDSQGLVDMKLVETEKNNGSLSLKLTELGKLIVEGNIDVPCVGKNCEKNNYNFNNLKNLS